MLTPSDLLRLSYAPDLTPTGIAYACRSLPHTYDRMGGSDFSRLRRIVAGKAVELAFRRYLGEQGVPYDDLGATPFTDPDHYDVGLDGRRCDLKCFQIFQKADIRRLHRDPSSLLRASALVPTDQLASEALTDDDLYIFAFLLALITTHQQDYQRALAAGQPAYLIGPLPADWAHPPRWETLGRLTLKSESSTPVSVELGGQVADRSFQIEEINLAPCLRARVEREFYSLAYLHVPAIPDGRVGIHSTKLDQLCLFHPYEWGNIWVYGMEIILAGFITRGEFRRRAHTLPPGSRVLQYHRTQTHNQALAIAELNPLSDLFAGTRRHVAQPNLAE